MSITTVTKPGWAKTLLRAAIIMCAGLLISSPAHATSIMEPATVFYGKILGTSGPQPFLVTEGNLAWTIRRADGRDLVLRAKLFPLKDGHFSYRLNVPHEALALGLATSLATVPLAPADQTHRHGGIVVNGKVARIAGNGTATFNVAQARRAATYRIDLEVPLEPADSDGDGLPDWWETKYRLDRSHSNDTDGDGLSDLQEYLRGSDPTRGNGEPALTTTELLAYADGTTSVMLQAVDADSDPGQLTYTLKTTPNTGQLVLRNARPDPESPDLPLAAGSEFTHQDIREGRILFVHSGETEEAASFQISLRDENPAHAPSAGTVRINLYRPGTDAVESVRNDQAVAAAALGSGAGVETDGDEDLRIRNYILSKEAGYIIWDGSANRLDQTLAAPSARQSAEDYRARFGADRSHVIIGGAGRNTLTGGLESDILIGRGQNDLLRGNGGADRFVFWTGKTGQNTIADFNIDESDSIDLARVLKGASRSLSSYLRLGSNGRETTIQINADGNGDDFSNLIITLAGVAPGTVELHELVDSGRLVVGALQLQPRVILTASNANASENGPEAGEFVLTRSGSIDSELAVKIGIGGSASNGTDYSKIDGTVLFARGQRTVPVAIAPFADTQPEPGETVELTILPGEGYETGNAYRAWLAIEDAQVVVSIEALEPLALRQPLTPGAFLIQRAGIIDRSVLVRLEISGEASSGEDYQPVLRFVNMAPGQTTAMIEIVPNAGAVLSRDGEAVALSIIADPTYKLGKNTQARVTLVERDGTFAAWRARQFPQAPGNRDAFAASDPGGFGISALARYAFGLDPARPDRTLLPKAFVRDGQLITEFWRRSDATDVEYVVEVSRDLVKWDSAGVNLQQAAVEKAGTRAGFVRYQAVSAADPQNLFMNVRAVLKP